MHLLDILLFSQGGGKMDSLDLNYQPTSPDGLLIPILEGNIHVDQANNSTVRNRNKT